MKYYCVSIGWLVSYSGQFKDTRGVHTFNMVSRNQAHEVNSFVSMVIGNNKKSSLPPE